MYCYCLCARLSTRGSVSGAGPFEPEEPFEPEIDPRAKQLAKEVSALPFYSRELALDAIEPVLRSIRKLTSETATPSAGSQRA